GVAFYFVAVMTLDGREVSQPDHRARIDGIVARLDAVTTTGARGGPCRCLRVPITASEQVDYAGKHMLRICFGDPCWYGHRARLEALPALCTGGSDVFHPGPERLDEIHGYGSRYVVRNSRCARS